MVRRSDRLKTSGTAAVLLIAVLAVVSPAGLPALSMVGGAVVLGIESEMGIEYNMFDEANREYLPGDTEAEWADFMDENMVIGTGRALGTVVITAFPFLLEAAAGIDGGEREFVVERAYFSVLGNVVSFSAGKQNVTWGTGVLYYPLFFSELLGNVWGRQSRDLDFPTQWTGEFRIDGISHQTTFRGIVEESAVEAASVPEWYFLHFHQQFFLASSSLSWQIAYECEYPELDHSVIPGVDFNRIYDNNVSIFGGFSGKIPLDGSGFEPRAAVGFSWLDGSLFISTEACWDEWFETGFHLSYDFAGTGLSDSLTLKIDPVGLGFMGILAVNYADQHLDLETGLVYMDGTERTYYGNSPVSFRLFANLTVTL